MYGVFYNLYITLLMLYDFPFKLFGYSSGTFCCVVFYIIYCSNRNKETIPALLDNISSSSEDDDDDEAIFNWFLIIISIALNQK